MADNIEVNDRASNPKTMAADEVSSVLYQVIKIALGGDGVAAFLSSGAGAADPGTLRAVLASDDVLTAINAAGGDTITTTITRPADTTGYSPGDAWANATSGAVTAAISGASRGSGKSGVITDIFLALPQAPGSQLTGELWIFDSAPATTLQDNAAWALTDADLLKCVAVIEFTMKSTGSSAGNSYAHLQGLSIGFTTVGGNSLYVVPKVTNSYAGSSSEALTIRTKVVRSN